MANRTVQLLPLKKRLSAAQQEHRAVRIAARAHARDVLTTELLQQRKAIIGLYQAQEARRPINVVKRLVSGAFGFLKKPWQKHEHTQSAPQARAKNFTMRRMG